MEQLKARFEKRYSDAFGCTWPYSPWGPSWLDVLHEAKDADTHFREARGLLEELHQVLHRAGEYLRKHNNVIAPANKRRANVGMTKPEFLLNALLLHDGVPLGREKLVKNALELVNSTDFRQMATCTARFVVETGGRSQGAAMGQLQPSRRYAWHEHNGVKSVYACLQGPPPRSLENVDEWTRATVTELLDFFALRDSRTPRGVRQSTNTDIAVVVLLATFEGLTADEIQRGHAEILKAERKKIAYFRKTRGVGPGVIKVWQALAKMVETGDFSVAKKATKSLGLLI